MSSAEASFACAPMQAGLLYETLSGAPGSYTQQVLITCREELEPDALRRAWIELVRRHDALRTSFIIGASTMPRQRVHDDVELGIVIADWRADSEPARESRWQELLLADRQVAFEPAQAPLMRVVICQLANTETRMLWSYHHSILDGRSRVALLGELFDIYAEKPLSRGASHCSRCGPQAAAVIRRPRPSGATFWAGSTNRPPRLAPDRPTATAVPAKKAPRAGFHDDWTPGLRPRSARWHLHMR